MFLELDYKNHVAFFNPNPYGGQDCEKYASSIRLVGPEDPTSDVKKNLIYKWTVLISEIKMKSCILWIDLIIILFNFN